MKLIMENWRNYLSEQATPRQAPNPCQMLKIANSLKSLESVLEQGNSETLISSISGALLSLQHLDDPSLLFDVDEFMDNQIDSMQGDLPRATRKAQEIFVDEYLKDMPDGPMPDDALEVAIFEVSLMALYSFSNTLIRKEQDLTDKGYNVYAASSQLQNIPQEMASKLKDVLQTYISDNDNIADERNYLEQCRSYLRGGGKKDRTKPKWNKSTIWCNILKQIPKMIEDESDKRNFPLPWKYDEETKEYKLGTRLGALHGPIKDYENCLFDHLSGQGPGASRRALFVQNNEEFQDLMDYYISKGPQKGDYIYKKMWPQGKFI